MKNLLLVLGVVTTIHVEAQMWCAPSAQWNHTVQAFGVEGYIVRTYAGDTLFEGSLSQRIHESGMIIQYWSGGDTLLVDNDRFTSLQDSTVFIWTNNSGAWEWDTLFRFDAVVGDRWFPPGADDVCADGYAGMLLVTGTGTMDVDGLALRTWSMSYSDALGEPWWDAGQFVERLGCMGGLEFLPGGCIIVEYGEALVCYTDTEISYNDAQWPYGCASFTAVHGIGDPPPFSLSPNPGTDELSIELADAVTGSSLALFDATGREVLRTPLNARRTTITTGHLRPGLFNYRLLDAQNGLLGRGSWMKL